MEEVAGPDTEIKIQIQNELVSITGVVTKIKEELHQINDIVQSNGSLDVALKNAIESLVIMAKNSGVQVEENLDTEANDNPMTDVLSKISMSYITEKLKSLSQQ